VNAARRTGQNLHTTCYKTPMRRHDYAPRADPKYLGAKIGVISILHTWGQTCCCIPTFTAPFLRAEYRQTTVVGFALGILFSCP
jgi:hypothetical protein